MSGTMLLEKPETESLTIRPYEPADYPVILALWEATDMKPYAPAQIERLLRVEGGALVAERRENGQARAIVGILLWTHNGQMALLWRVAVHPDFRGRGIASRLVKQAERDILAAGLDGVALLTRDANTAAQALYTKLGYHHNAHHQFWGKRLEAAPDAEIC